MMSVKTATGYTVPYMYDGGSALCVSSEGDCEAPCWLAQDATCRGVEKLTESLPICIEFSLFPNEPAVLENENNH